MSVLGVEAIIHRRRGSSRAAHRAEAFLSRGSAVENGHYVESRSNSGNKPKEKGSGIGRTSSGIDPEPRPFGPTNRPKDILKTTGRDVSTRSRFSRWDSPESCVLRIPKYKNCIVLIDHLQSDQHLSPRFNRFVINYSSNLLVIWMNFRIFVMHNLVGAKRLAHSVLFQWIAFI